MKGAAWTWSDFTAGIVRHSIDSSHRDRVRVTVFCVATACGKLLRLHVSRPDWPCPPRLKSRDAPANRCPFLVTGEVSTLNSPLRQNGVLAMIEGYYNAKVVEIRWRLKIAL